ncbi:histidine kinase [Paraflavitalea sp. CAU 1676]|uniref:sensor histidine kinase n=1 Tax=Paraflavitalea sp. CAU 1676 TaxID=3032598 RepID=UPI0023DCE4D8|nr:histidine kinase [Paraflavitalea sp. CAU 1676]MDF2188572.1 histidine kinase [Paraflavitalea sp. CAU 1676]
MIKPWMKPTRVEWISFFTLMPVLTALLNHLLFGERMWHDRTIWLYSFPLIYVQGFFSWYFHIVSMHWLRIRLPDLHHTLLRLTVLAATHIGLTSLTFAGLFYGFDYFHFLGYVLDVHQFKTSILLAVALTLIATTSWEAEYVIIKWKESLAEKEEVQQLAIQYEFETLKSQVNPHFLFNCFNTLSSLISEDARQAESFLDELSKVYRYLLRNNEDGLSTLQNELKFIESYYRLLKTRHGEAIQIQMEVDKRYDNYLLPSLSLQLLVENAVKHNVVSKYQPLVIDIFTMAGNQLAVNNNLQCKTIKDPSNKIGLANIRLKYELLDQPGFQVLSDTRNFTVILPLIWDSGYEKKISAVQKQIHPH